ncbi:SoxR reducing system RseC family protein [uncultured Ilyobacter sp.]|uniref:SoxR reducing system RseC family protein n=1 Tax=uncultured Ilyobacter sp. TaxID=544433 RepID=UPI0029C8555B|nr:SoxR reducing system RseC family protein [uncultured Ilyobacter sp.]
MINKGIIEEIDHNRIKVHLYRDSACAHCSGCSSSNKMGSTFSFKYDEKLSIGDIVTFEIEDSSLLNIAALVYLMPILFMMAGYFIGQKLGFSEGQGVFMSFLFLALSFGIIYYFDKKRGEKLIDQKIKVISVDKPTLDDEVNSCSLDK